MIKGSFFRTVFLTGMLGLLVSNVNAQSNIRVLSASDVTCIGGGTCLNWTDSITGTPNPDPAQNIGGGYWSQTYLNTTGFGLGSFKLTHNSGASMYSYWGGFTSGANGDTRNFGFADTTGHVGSVNWVQNQWGVMAGSGVNSSIPYLIAYWDYFSDGIDLNAKSLQVSLAGDSLFNPQSVWICNHPWPYYGNIYGDGFARPLNKSGDYFRLYIHAIHNDNSHDSVYVDLAEYDSDSEELIQSQIWQPFSLTKLGTDVKYIYFTMYSTDSDPIYGPNTAVYFNVDKLTVEKTGKVAASAAVQKAKAPATLKFVEVSDYFPIPSYTGGEVVVYNTKGKEAWRTAVKAGEKPNLSKLPAGEYRLQHGHKVIPIIKKGNTK
jgi:hypothetical protein